MFSGLVLPALALALLIVLIGIVLEATVTERSYHGKPLNTWWVYLIVDGDSLMFGGIHSTPAFIAQWPPARMHHPLGRLNVGWPSWSKGELPGVQNYSRYTGTARVWHLSVLVLALPLALMTSRGIHMLARRARGRCLACGYSLRGNVTGRCPECGRRCRRTVSRAETSDGEKTEMSQR